MATTIDVPSFDFAGFYYAQILERLMTYKRQNVPELTDESDYEPFIQLMKMMSLVGHLNNVTIDLVANESTLPTAQLVETVRNMLRLISYELKAASPSQVDLVYQLSRVFSAPFAFITDNAQAGTQRDASGLVIYFEALEDLTIERTDQFGAAFSYKAGTGVYTDRTDAVNSSNPADDFQAWVAPAVKDALYFGHSNVMWTEMAVDIAVAAANITGVWEFYDGDFPKIQPSSITVIGSTLEVNLTSLLGSANRQGTKVRVQLNETTAFEDAEVVWTGSVNKVTVGLLGQTSASTDPTKYTVGSDWTIIDDVVDGPLNFTVDGAVDYSLPQTLDKYWKTTTINGVEAFWIRYRIVQVSTPTSPTIRQVRMDTGKQYAIRQATQGQTGTDSPLGSSTGLGSQSFDTTRDWFITNSDVVTVEDETWTRVTNFLNSGPADKHYIVELGANDRASVIFGDGVTGKIPPLGVGNISIIYRFGANNDGNVGAQTVNVDKTGLTYVNSIFNPRAAAGWSQAEGTDKASLERAKIAGPASIRVKDVALNGDDAVQLTSSFTDVNGARPFARSRAFEEGFGPKTVELVVVAAGGAAATNDQLTALETFFNGDPTAIPPVSKHFVANQEVIAVNYTQHPIDIAATVYGNVTEAQVLNELSLVFQPTALKSDGVTYQWDFGDSVPLSRLDKEIHLVDESITKVVVTTPAAEVALQPRELPIIGTVTITVVKPT